MRSSISLIALLTVAACSSSSSTQSASDVAGVAEVQLPAEVIAFNTAVADFEADALAVGLTDAETSNTRFDAIPTAGTADFAGFVNVNAGPTANLSAQIGLTADFATTEITGEQTSPFFAETDGVLEEYEGEIAVTFGRVGARGIPNNARIDIAGTINNDTNTVVVDGEILGKFIATPIVGAVGEATVGDSLSITLNDEAVVDGSAGFAVTLQ